MRRNVFISHLIVSGILSMLLLQSCRMYEDNAFFTFTGQIVNQDNEPIKNFAFGFGELNIVSGLRYEENGMPERRFVRVIYTVNTEPDGSFRVVLPQKNSPQYYLVTYGGAKFQISNFSGEFESDVSEANYFLTETERISIDLGQIKVIVP